MSNVERIYGNFERLYEGYADLPEASEARDNLWNFLESQNCLGGGKTKMEIDSLIGELACMSEKQGFIYGFRYAVSLLVESGGVAHV